MPRGKGAWYLTGTAVLRKDEEYDFQNNDGIYFFGTYNTATFLADAFVGPYRSIGGLQARTWPVPSSRAAKSSFFYEVHVDRN